MNLKRSRGRHRWAYPLKNNPLVFFDTYLRVPRLAFLLGMDHMELTVFDTRDNEPAIVFRSLADEPRVSGYLNFNLG